MKTYSEALKVIIETGKSYNNYYIYFYIMLIIFNYIYLLVVLSLYD